MMLYPAMSELLEQVPSRYQLVNVVAARARKIAALADQEGLMLEEKPVSIAIKEIAEGHLDDPVDGMSLPVGVLPETEESAEAEPAHLQETPEE